MSPAVRKNAHDEDARVVAGEEKKISSEKGREE